MSSATGTVLLLSDYGGSYAGSFVPMLRATAVAARERGFEVACAFTPVSRDRAWLAELEADGIEIRFPPAADRATLSRWLAGWLGELDGPVILHTHFTAFELPAVSAASSRPDARVVWHLHSHLPGSPRLFARTVVKYGIVARRVARILCVSEAIAAAARRRGTSSSRLTVIFNGLDTARFALVDAAPARGREAHRSESIRRRRSRCTSAGAGRRRAGPCSPKSLARLRAAGSDAVGISVGGGAGAREDAVRLGLGDALRAAEPSPDVRGFYAAADLFFATSHGEGGEPPFAILEALASGVAVVAGDVPGHRVAPRPAALKLAEPAPAELAAVAATALGRARPSATARPARRTDGWSRTGRWPRSSGGRRISMPRCFGPPRGPGAGPAAVRGP